MTVSGSATNDAWVSGGYADEDEHAGSALWAAEAGGGIWTPDCWHMSPEQLQERARAMNEAAFASAAANAGKHSNPPAFARDRSYT